jgi:glutamyl-tRNA synthetase
MNQIITRFPPSPTGYLHIGGARTALFNWLYARHSQGKFILRIEDTDTQRSTQASVDAIFDALDWLGIDWDDGPYFQSKRLSIYDAHVKKLVESGNAYYCTCSPDRLEEMRKRAQDRGQKPKYDGTCRDKQLAPSPGAVVRFAAPVTGSTVVKDVIKGNIVFQNDELDDFVIQRSDGMPTYNFVVVVDDITMGINTVIRGDDHVNNTPKQIMLYQALGSPLPTFGHVPMVLGADKARLSKRHGAMSVTAYREMGYLPEALINYLVRLGWSHGDQEFFTRDELIEKFSLENVGKSAGIFNPDKLLALNADHIKAYAPERLAPLLKPFLTKEGYDVSRGPAVSDVVATLNTRSKTLTEMAGSARFYYENDIQYEEKAAKKFLTPESLDPLLTLTAELSALPDFDLNALEAAFKKVMDKTGLKLGKVAQPVRVALTGTTVSPGIFEVINVLGRKETLHRLTAATVYINHRAGGN